MRRIVHLHRSTSVVVFVVNAVRRLPYEWAAAAETLTLDSWSQERVGCRSSGVKPVRLAIRANIFGPISSYRGTKTASGQFGRASVHDGSQTGASVATRSSTGRPGRVGPLTRRPVAQAAWNVTFRNSAGLLGVRGARRSLAGQGLARGQRLHHGPAVTHDTGEQRHFGQPAPIVFPLKFNRKRHAGTCNIRAGCLTSAGLYG